MELLSLEDLLHRRKEPFLNSNVASCDFKIPQGKLQGRFSMRMTLPFVSTKCWFAFAEISIVFQKHPTLPSFPLIRLTSILAIPVSTLTSILGRLNVKQPGSKYFYKNFIQNLFSTCKKSKISRFMRKYEIVRKIRRITMPPHGGARLKWVI